MSDRNSGPKTDLRNPDGTFARGNPGKPRGARNRATQAVRDLLEGQTDAITRAAIDKALEGDVGALRLCLERVHPPVKDSPIEFNLPSMTCADDAATAAGSVLSAVSAGTLTPNEGATVMALIENYRKTLETTEIEARLAALEAKA